MSDNNNEPMSGSGARVPARESPRPRRAPLAVTTTTTPDGRTRRLYRRKRARCPCDCCSACNTCTCCGTCPLGCATWLSELRKMWILYLVLMFAVSVLWFAGSGAALFEQADLHQIWSSWYRCQDTFIVNTTGSKTSTAISSASSTAATLGILVGRDYSCVTTPFQAETFWACPAIATRFKQLGGLQVSGFVFSVICIFLTICHMARRWKFPCVPFFFSLIVLAEGIAICVLTWDLWSVPQCPNSQPNSTLYYPLFNTTLRTDSKLRLGVGYPLLAAATLLSACALFVLGLLWCYPDGKPKHGMQSQPSGRGDDEDDDEQRGGDENNNDDNDDDDGEMEDDGEQMQGSHQNAAANTIEQHDDEDEDYDHGEAEQTSR